MPEPFVLVEVPASALKFDATSEQHPPHHLQAFLTHAAGRRVDVRTVALSFRDYAELATSLKSWLRYHRLPVDAALVPMPSASRKAPRGHALVPVAP